VKNGLISRRSITSCQRPHANEIVKTYDAESARAEEARKVGRSIIESDWMAGHDLVRDHYSQSDAGISARGFQAVDEVEWIALHRSIDGDGSRLVRTRYALPR
jgi:hypothetical protein